jgi:hypothetical protein
MPLVEWGQKQHQIANDDSVIVVNVSHGFEAVTQ